MSKQYETVIGLEDGNNVDLSTENVELAAEQINYNALIDSMNNEFSRFKAVLK